MTPDRASLTGKMVDKYELLEKVGEGGMAEVYRGRHVMLGREVAVKLLHPHLSSTERNRIRFEREARAIEALEHEHILRIYDYSGRDSPVCYIVTEFIEGYTLKEVLSQNGRIPSEVAAMVAIELCEALQFAHQHGIIHRDIKPENVMIRTDGVVKLMDFGIARVLDESSMTLTGGLVGSPAYMSPEQASDKAVDVRSDIFSLGTLLYRAVTGHLPFNGGSAPVILRNILDGHYADPMDVEPGLAPGMAEVIRKALSTDPAARFPTARHMATELSSVLEQSGMACSHAELQRYIDDPTGYEGWLRVHLSTRLTEEGQRLLTEGNQVTAMKLFNRVLYLDEHNEAVLALIQSLHRTRRPRTRLLLATFFVLVFPLGAVVGLGLSHRDAFWEGPARAVGTESGRAPAEPGDSGLELQPAGELASLDETTLESADAPGLEPPSAGVLPAGDPPAGKSETGREPPVPERALTEPRVLPGRTMSPPSRAATAATAPRGHRGNVRGSPEKQQSPSRAQVSGAPLDAEIRPALVHLRAVPYAEIFINGQSYGNTIQRKDPITLPPGVYRLRLVNPLCEVLEETVTLAAGQIFEPLYRLAPLPARLFLRNFDLGTELFLDGNRLGLVPGITQPVLVQKPRQAHVLRARSPDGSVKEWSIPELDPKEDYTVDASSPLPGG